MNVEEDEVPRRPERYEGYFKGNARSKLHLVSWIPQHMRALVILIHGHGDHMMRYNAWAGLFNDKQIGVIGFDMYGHGKSSGIRGDFAYRKLIRDIDSLVQYTHLKYPFVPKILYGHGMGGNLVIKYSIEYKPSVTGVISSSPWLRLVREPQEKRFPLSGLLGRIFPVMPFLSITNALHLSHDKQIIRDYLNDPLVNRKITPRLYYSLVRSGNFIMKNRHKVNIPLLLMHGSSDKITSHKATAEFGKYTSDNTNIKIWEGAYHELHNENEKIDVFNYILHWMESLPLFRVR